MAGPYFIGHTESVMVRIEELERLWEDRIAVHFPGDTSRNERASESRGTHVLRKTDEKDAMGAFVELAEEASYVWTQSYVLQAAKVRYVRGRREVARA